MTISKFKLSTTNLPLSDDTTNLLLSYIKDNYDQSATNISKEEINFANSTRELDSSRYLIVVWPLTSTLEDYVAGGHNRMVHDTKRVYIVCNGQEEMKNHERLKQHVHDLINTNPQGIAEMEDMQILDFTPITNFSDQNFVNMVADDSLIKASYARVDLRYSVYY